MATIKSLVVTLDHTADVQEVAETMRSRDDVIRVQEIDLQS